MSCSSTVHAWSVDELGLTLADGSCAASAPSGWADQVDHMLVDEGMGCVMEAEELEAIVLTGGVVLQGGSAKYDLFRMSQNEMNSRPSSISPFNLTPYLKAVNH